MGAIAEGEGGVAVGWDITELVSLSRLFKG